MNTNDAELRPQPGPQENFLKSQADIAKIIRGPWNDSFLRVLENFPVAKHDDEVDGLSGAHGVLCDASGGFTRASDFRIPQPTGHEPDLTLWGPDDPLGDAPLVRIHPPMF